MDQCEEMIEIIMEMCMDECEFMVGNYWNDNEIFKQVIVERVKESEHLER